MIVSAIAGAGRAGELDYRAYRMTSGGECVVIDEPQASGAEHLAGRLRVVNDSPSLAVILTKHAIGLVGPCAPDSTYRPGEAVRSLGLPIGGRRESRDLSAKWGRCRVSRCRAESERDFPLCAGRMLLRRFQPRQLLADEFLARGAAGKPRGLENLGNLVAEMGKSWYKSW